MEEEIRAHKTEYGINFEDGRLYEVIKAFMMKTREGPLEAAQRGEIVFVSQRFGNELLSEGKAIPKDLSENFEAIRGFRFVKDGEYVNVEKGDIIKMTPLEAVEHLRRLEVKEKRGEIK